MREDLIFSYSLIQDFKSTRFWLLPHKIMLGPRTGDNTNSTDRSLDSNRLGELNGSFPAGESIEEAFTGMIYIPVVSHWSMAGTTFNTQPTVTTFTLIDGFRSR